MKIAITIAAYLPKKEKIFLFTTTAEVPKYQL